MTFNVFSDKVEASDFVVCNVAIAICLPVGSLRILLAAHRKNGLRLEDWFALLALLTFLTYTSINLWSK